MVRIDEGAGPGRPTDVDGQRPLSEEERTRLLYEWNDTRVPYPDVCVHQLFEQQVERSPDAIALICKEQRLSYCALNERANQLAKFLRKNGVGPGSLVGVLLERSPELVVALLGVWKAGAAYVPLDPAYPKDRLSFMVSDAAVGVLLTEAKCKALCPGDTTMTICLDDDWPVIAQGSTSNLDVAVVPTSLAYVMYTSGSTGQPKGAMILHAGLVNYLCWAVKTYRVEPGGSVPVHSSIAFDLTVTSLYPALLAGAQVELLAEDVGAQSLLSALRQRRTRSLVKITPAHLDVLTQRLRPDELSGLSQAFVIGGENLPAESLDAWRDLAPQTRLINEYGPTETVVGCCVHEVKVTDPRHGPVPIGRPIANTQLYVLDESLQPVPVGQTGELFIGGAGVARGYLNRPQLTQERFLPDPFSGRAGATIYRTGDLARYRPDGTLEFLGRVDNQVKVRGYRIELGEIEAALASHPDVQSCAVLAREDSTGNKQLVGYVVARSGRIATGEVHSFLGRKLPEYMVPAHLVVLDALPLTANGKVDRKALPAPSEVSAQVGKSVTPPRNDVERAVAEVWADLLKVETIGIDDDFFDLGGHSLLAIRALARIRDLFGVDLEPQVLFENSTLATLAALIPTSKGEAKDSQSILPRADDGPAPVSFAQEQLWLLDQLVPGSPAYNIVDVVSIHGTYDGRAMKDALAALVARHETLRTTFLRNDGQLRQVVSPPFEPALPEQDLRFAPEEERQRMWTDIVREQGRKSFHLGQMPLFRICVVHMSATEHRILLTIHHIVADEWSMELIQKEVPELYAAFRQGRPPALAPLSVHYADFAAWQRENLTGELLQGQSAYWKQQLESALPVLALPTDKPRPAGTSLRGATECFALPGGILTPLQSIARQDQATLFMVLESAFAALLHRYTGQNDILVGTPISGRTHTEAQQMIGCFLNTVVLRAQFQDDPSFRALLRQTRDRALGAYGHADLPLQQLVAELSLEREPGRTPLFQVMFILHSRDGLSQVAKASGNHALETGTSKFDLTLSISENKEGLEGIIEYSTDLFEAASIRRLCRCYSHLLGAIAREPEQRVSKLPILDDADREQLLVAWNDTAVTFSDVGACLHQLVADQAARSPQAVALQFEHETLSYREPNRQSDRLARHLSRLGVGPDVLVGILLERSLDMVVGVLGILKAGAAYVPLDPSFPPGRLAFAIDDARMQVLVTHRGLEAILPNKPATVVRLDHPLGEGDLSGGAVSSTGQVRPDHLAYVLYTSGSTGTPKGVGISHAAIVNFLLSMQRQPGLTTKDTLLAVTTLSFDIAGLELFLPLICGAKVVLASREDVMDARRLATMLQACACTYMQATPATWRALLDAGWKGTPGLKALCGGEAMPFDLAQALLPRCLELWNMYGPTETTVWSTIHRVTAQETVVPIGRPIANTQVYVLDANRELVPVSAVGELYIGGHGLARGYWHRDELTQERFVPNPFAPGNRLYRTGDLARWREEGGLGKLECLGRTDHQVKLRGYRIELGEIEACLSRHPDVCQVAVIAREDEPGDKRLAAYVVANHASLQLTEPLRAHLRKHIPEYMVPSHFVFLDALPLTPNGKVDRKALPRPNLDDAATNGAAGTYAAPRTELEVGLVAAWQRVLGIAKVGIHDNFFALGGNSLDLVKLMLEMEKLTGVEITLGTIFRYPTIAGLVSTFASKTAEEASLVIPLQPEGDGPPIFCFSGVLLYQELAANLGKRQPVFGVYVAEEQALTRQALRGDKVSIQGTQLAKAYCDAILKVAPRGPYRLAGSSFGGVVALEVASLLRRVGAQVDFVGLLDTLSPRAVHRNRMQWAYHQMGDILRGEVHRKVLRKVSQLRDRLVPHEPSSEGENSARAAERAHAIKQAAFYQATEAWQAGHLDSGLKVVLFRAAQRNWGAGFEFDRDYGWHHYLGGPISVVDVPGDHLGMLKAPNVADLAQKVQRYLTD